MNEILRDLETFGKFLALLREHKVQALETQGLKIAMDTDAEEVVGPSATIGFNMESEEDFEEPEAKRIGFTSPYKRLKLEEIK